MTDTLSTRAHDLTAGLQTREYALTLRADEAPIPGGSFDSIGVPLGQETELFPRLFESVAPGAITPRAHRPLLWRHDEPIGLITAANETPDAWTYTATISDTVQGRDATTLIRDGVVRSSSIGFTPIASEITEDENGLHVRHTAIDVREVSLVPFPAYAGAAVTAVRSATDLNTKENTAMTDAPAIDPARIDSLEERAADIERAMQLIRTAPTDDATSATMPHSSSSAASATTCAPSSSTPTPCTISRCARLRGPCSATASTTPHGSVTSSS